MKKLKDRLEEANKKMSFKERRKKYFEKNMIIIKDYESLTKEELMIEYADKCSKYEFQKNFLIGTMITTFVAIMAGGLKTIYLLLVSFLKSSLNVNDQIEEAIAIFHIMGIAIIVLFIFAFLLFMYLYFRDTRKLYKDLLILEEVKKNREEV